GRLHREVALKIVRPRATDAQPEAQARERVLREARAAASLQHANVVGIFDVGEVTLADGAVPVAYIAMELVRGRSLRTYIGDREVSAARKLAWLVEVARALEVAHGAGLIHRDIKPENVMIQPDDSVKVLDFGIAKLT